jgi:hypothetical protein
MSRRLLFPSAYGLAGFLGLVAGGAISPSLKGDPSSTSLVEFEMAGGAQFEDAVWKPVLQNLQRRWLLTDEEVQMVKDVLLDQMRQLKVMRQDRTLSDLDKLARERVVVQASRQKILAILKDPERLRKLIIPEPLGNTISSRHRN